MNAVLIVEDSRVAQRTLQLLFPANVQVIQIASDGINGQECLGRQPPTAVLPDLKLPEMSGSELCREFNSIRLSVPIVVLSANSAIEDEVLLLELGADDSVTNPFSPKELLARVRHAMQHGNWAAPSNSQTVDAREVIMFGDVRIDFTNMEASRSGRPVTMTAQEFKVVRFFARSPGRVISREELLSEVWGYRHYPSTRTVDNHILRLRHKLEPDPRNPQYFLTLYGAGYKFVPNHSLC